MTPRATATVTALPPEREQFDELVSWVRSAHPGPVSILEVGGGGGFYDFPSRLRANASRMVGVDPEPGVLARPWFDAAYRETVEQYAPHAGEVFDVAMCVYVLEHVDTPDAFLGAVRSLLAPGGSCFGVTPNLLHYFGAVSAAASRLGIEDWLLHRVRPAELIDAYHSPVRYRLNTVRRISDGARSAGFARAEFRTLEQPGMFETYFPRWLRWWPGGYSAALHWTGSARFFGTLIFRLCT